MTPTSPLTSSGQIVSNLEIPAVKEKGSRVARLLNPRSLLSRRRTSHTSPQLASSATLQAQTSLPSTSEDPSIRGTRVHDFDRSKHSSKSTGQSGSHSSEGTRDAPRLLPSPDLDGPGYTKEAKSRFSGWSGGEHVPAFTEDFDEEQYPAAGPQVRKVNDLSDFVLPELPFVTSYNSRITPSTRNAQNPAGTQNVAVYDHGVVCNQSDPSAKAQIGNENTPTTLQSYPKEPCSDVKTRSRNVSGASTRDFLLTGSSKPRHMKSTSSRFSFDMLGAANQEKLLEDRHRQKARERKQSNPIDNDSDEPLEGDYEDDNGMFDDADIEEEVPMVGEDADYDSYIDMEREIPADGEHDMVAGAFVDAHDRHNDIYSHPNLALNSLPQQESEVEADGHETELAGLERLTIDGNFLNMNKDNTDNTSSTSSNPSINSPRNAVHHTNTHNGRPLSHLLETDNFAVSTPSIPHSRYQQPATFDSKIDESIHSPNFGLGLGLQGVAIDHDEDDLYFDDGTFDQAEAVGVQTDFDESIFDNDDTDQYGRPLSNLLQSSRYVPSSAAEEPQSPLNPEATNTTPIRAGRNQNHLRISTGSAKAVKFETTGSIHKSSVDRNSLIFQQPTLELTHDTLNAYQSALAAAAQTAAKSGRFDRSNSISVDQSSLIEPSDYDLPVIRDDLDEALNFEDNLKSVDDYGSVIDDFDYDDALDDEAIIAEANAEALASDCDGFYGQEFGFYSTPIPAGKKAVDTVTEPSLGGFFGSREADGLLRSKSGRIVREPNLTPITERSEFSNRNSMLSLAPSTPGRNMSSPGLAQLAVMDQWDENDMSLSTLMKIRRSAWGGSQPSVRSSNGEGSPHNVVGEESSTTRESFSSPGTRPGLVDKRRPSMISVTVSEASSLPASPTVTLSNAAKQMQLFNSKSRVMPEHLRRSSFTSSTLAVPSPTRSISGGADFQTPQRISRHRHTSSVESVP